MRILKLGLISLIMFFLLITAISLFIPSSVRVSRAINIQATRESIWNQVDDFEKWKEWNPFFANADSVGFEHLEGGNAVRLGETTVRWKSKQPDERIAELINSNPRPVLSVWKTINYASTDSITLHWYMDFSLRWYPWEKFSSLMLEKSYGPSMEKGLSNLKNHLEE